MLRRVALVLLAAIALHLGLPHLHAGASDAHPAVRPIATELVAGYALVAGACGVCAELARSGAKLPAPAPCTTLHAAIGHQGLLCDLPTAPAHLARSPQRSRAPPTPLYERILPA